MNATWNIIESFNNNLIAENRYQMILEGLQVTLLITFFAAILGTLLGGLVCWARESLREQVKELIEEPTTRGFRVKLII